jgi:hypothetical protein
VVAWAGERAIQKGKEAKKAASRRLVIVDLPEESAGAPARIAAGPTGDRVSCEPRARFSARLLLLARSLS